jgi:hypothetical protein
MFDLATGLLSQLETLGSLKFSGRSIFEVLSLPKKRREQETIIKEELGKLMIWHNYIDELQASCSAGIMKFPRGGGQGAENLRKKNRHVHENQTEPKDLRP